MDKNSDKTFFWAGTLFLYGAMVILTVLPKMICDYMPWFYININHYRTAAAAFFTLAFAFYLFSKSTYKSQLISIGVSFAFFYIFSAFSAAN